MYHSHRSYGNSEFYDHQDSRVDFVFSILRLVLSMVEVSISVPRLPVVLQPHERYALIHDMNAHALEFGGANQDQTFFWIGHDVL